MTRNARTEADRARRLVEALAASRPGGWSPGARWHSAVPGVTHAAAEAMASAALRRSARGGRAPDVADPWPYTTVEMRRGASRERLCYGPPGGAWAAALARSAAAVLGATEAEVTAYLATGAAPAAWGVAEGGGTGDG